MLRSLQIPHTYLITFLIILHIHTSRCPKWQLPSVCSLDPPTSGKCCPTPNCPPGFTINYPSGFLQDMGISSGLADGQKPKIETLVSDSSVTKTETTEPIKDTGSTNLASETSKSSGFSNLKTILEVGSVGINSGEFSNRPLEINH